MTLVRECDRVPTATITGEREVLESAAMEHAFERVVACHRPQHSTLLLSTCSGTRPYSRSTTWKMLCRVAEGRADCVVTSSGGVIPIAFEREWPFMQYDAHRIPQLDELYVSIMARRLVRFLVAHPYRRVVAAFTPLKRNLRAIRTAVCNPAVSTRLAVVPSASTWSFITRRVPAKNARRTTEAYKADGFMYYPILHPAVTAELEAVLKEA